LWYCCGSGRGGGSGVGGGGGGVVLVVEECGVTHALLGSVRLGRRQREPHIVLEHIAVFIKIVVRGIGQHGDFLQHGSCPIHGFVQRQCRALVATQANDLS
jgi:hypothetical protein